MLLFGGEAIQTTAFFWKMAEVPVPNIIPTAIEQWKVCFFMWLVKCRVTFCFTRNDFTLTKCDEISCRNDFVVVD